MRDVPHDEVVGDVPHDEVVAAGARAFVVRWHRTALSESLGGRRLSPRSGEHAKLALVPTYSYEPAY
jgi:hypothetical protein